MSHLFCVNGSFNISFFDDRSLENSLFDNWLRNDFACDDGLVDYFLVHLRNRYRLGFVSDVRLRIIDILVIRSLLFSCLDFSERGISGIGVLVNFLVSVLNDLQLT